MTAKFYHLWSNDVEIVLWGMGPQKFGGKPFHDLALAKGFFLQNDSYEQPVDALISEEDGQESDLALAYILIPVSLSFDVMGREPRFPWKAWVPSKGTCQTDSEASFDAKLLQLQVSTLKKGEHIVEYLIRICAIGS